MTVVEIVEVTLDSSDEALVACGLDTPAAGHTSSFYGFDLRGWAVGRNAPATSMIARHAGGELGRVPIDIARPDVAEQYPTLEGAGSSGFFLPVGALKLDMEFEIEFDAALEDGTRAPLGRIAGRRARLATSFEPGIEPIALTALGRTGSTAVARLLASHPEVVAYRPFEYEPRVVTYWLDVIRDLSEPAAFRRQVAPQGPLDDSWWIGKRPPFPRRLMDDEIQSLLGGENIDELALFCQRRIERFYRRVAALAGRDDATRFVEKLGPRTGALLRELYTGAREIVLVRDFRDMVASIFAFNRKRGFAGFGRGRAASDAEYVTAHIASSVEKFAEAWRTRSQGAHLLRYEDLVLRPRESVVSMLDYLELDAGPTAIEPMLASLRSPESELHRTISAPERSIGRWRHDLSPEVQEACADALGPALRAFGYEDGRA
jgi:Sulfotransferase family